MSIEKEIFEIISKKGDGIFDKIHIIDHHKNGFLGGNEFMVYYADGLCFLTSRRLPDEDDDIIDIEDGFVFNVFSEYEGFSEVSKENILRVIKKAIK